jgi:hypothetical protein
VTPRGYDLAFDSRSRSRQVAVRISAGIKGLPRGRPPDRQAVRQPEIGRATGAKYAPHGLIRIRDSASSSYEHPPRVMDPAVFPAGMEDRRIDSYDSW